MKNGNPYNCTEALTFCTECKPGETEVSKSAARGRVTKVTPYKSNTIHYTDMNML